MMKLGFFLYGTGHHIASWRDPGVAPNANQSLRHYIDITPDRRARAVRFRLQRRQQLDLRSRRSGDVEAHHQRDAARAADPARRAVGGDHPHRADLDGDDHLSRSVPCGADVRHARPVEPGPHRLERGDLVGRVGGVQLQPRQARAARRPLSPRRRVHRGGAGPLGHLGGRRLHPGQGEGPVLRSRQDAHAPSQGRALLGARAADGAALAAGPAGDRAGRPVGRRPRACGAHRRGAVHGGAAARAGARVLRRPEGAGGEVRPLAGFAQDHAGRADGGGPDQGRGAGKVRPASGADPSRARRAGAVGHRRHSTCRSIRSTGRCPTCR